ncbi:hypothetical protein [Amaricoccus solimangrovi]|uniref:Uncharacterized protein n=1 Tax=Amaricoccus solimangrovi TaxID=2589815 RepID=A0A501W5X3_9RHOB|nr:hypothetical protein [Amaricoccus solimangrovi]TPE44142.1 hypothetical protein FJM51_23115 [Amaricoccus solimangrovi]
MRFVRWLFNFEIHAPAGIAAIALAAFAFAWSIVSLGRWAIDSTPPFWVINVSSVQVRSYSLAVIVDRVVKRDFEGDLQVDVRQIAVANEPGDPRERTVGVCHGRRMNGISFKAGPYPVLIGDGGPRSGEVRDLNWYLGNPPNRSCDIVGVEGAYRAEFTYFYPWPQSGWFKG